MKYCESKGLLYIGTGVSGGEEGARHGPSIMPGGSPAAWPHVKDIFQGVSAKVEGNVPCCDWVGEGGAGHYVKMVHNGIEYGDMQLICEAYNILKNGLGLSAQEMHDVFAEWNKGELDSYLIEISRDILAFKDTDGSPLVDKILDTAGQKGTGKWTVINSQDLGIPITLMAEAVYSRCVSALKDERVKAARKLKGPRPALTSIAANPEKKKAFIADIMSALYASKIVSYAQGYMLMRAAAKEYGWNLNYGGIALMWRGGCIIRSRFLGKIKEAYDNNPKLTNLLLDDYFRGEIKKSQKGWRNIVATAAKKGIPVPAFSTALAFLRPISSAPFCRRICCRRSAIISARTPTNAWTNRAANSSTPTGPAAAARRSQHLQCIGVALALCANQSSHRLEATNQFKSARLRLRAFYLKPLRLRATTAHLILSIDDHCSQYYQWVLAFQSGGTACLYDARVTTVSVRLFPSDFPPVVIFYCTGLFAP